MTGSVTGIDYSLERDEYLAQIRAKYGIGTSSGAINASDASIFNNAQNAGDYGNNTCTDGQNDGKIGFFSAVGNIIEGVGKGLVNSVKGMFCDSEGHFSLWSTLKTVAIGAACFIPVVGPAIGMGLAAYGVFNGAKTVVTAAIKADQATTDAEAKAAFEEIGSGTLTTGVSLLGVKASAGALRGQLAANTTSATVKAFRGGARGTELAKAAMSETGSNMVKAATATAKGVQRKIGKVNEFCQNVKNNGFRNTVKTGIADLAGKTKAKVGSLCDELANKKQKYTDKAKRAADSAKQKAADLKQANEASIKKAQDLAKKKNIPAKDCYENGVPKEVKTTKGKATTVRKYDKNGNVTSETITYKNSKNTTKVEYKSGKKVETEIKFDAKGKETVIERTTYTGNRKSGTEVKVNGKVTSSNVQTTSRNGNVTETNIRTKDHGTTNFKETVNDKLGNEISTKQKSVNKEGVTTFEESTQVSKSGSSYNTKKVYNPETKKMDTTTTVDIGGQGVIENATWFEKAFAKLDSGRFGNLTTSGKFYKKYLDTAGGKNMVLDDYSRAEFINHIFGILAEEETI